MAGFDGLIKIYKVAPTVVPQNVVLSQISMNKVRLFVQPFHRVPYLKTKCNKLEENFHTIINFVCSVLLNAMTVIINTKANS